MFRCAVTGKVSQPKEPQRKVVMEVRPRTYVNRVRRVDEKTLREYTEEVVSEGFEIVREIGVSEAGYKILQGEKEGAA